MEATLPIGWLGNSGKLYCSRVCAAARAESEALPVDEQEYDVLAESGALSGGAVCPACGSDYTILWPAGE